MAPRPRSVFLPRMPRSSPLRAAISGLINCESCSLETLNHSFSVLSRAAGLAALTRVPPCLPNAGDGGVEVGGGGGVGGDGGGVGVGVEAAHLDSEMPVI
ncbi:hypothetical protein EYF80_044803 [Liparis tanakae]|uniref:Uncharacterized protein n=1 Tax=Liparis tanakae TaxID=230148 RepID=A0A4Z2FUU1_9TELE|nr:hypothetical protein EYF80_044803 [Liparis tanakae]